MLVAIHQPHYLPWLDYIDKVARADCFVFLDTVNFTRGGWQNRNYIHGPNGRQLLSVPVGHSGHSQALIDTKLSYVRDWRRKHFASILHNYASSSYFDHFLETVDAFYQNHWQSLADLGKHSCHHMFDLFCLKTIYVNASDLGKIQQKKTALLVEICRRLGATQYLSGDGANYLDLQLFEEAGIEVIRQNFIHPTYEQGDNSFTSHLAAWDVLFHLGLTGARQRLGRTVARS